VVCSFGLNEDVKATGSSTNPQSCCAGYPPTCKATTSNNPKLILPEQASYKNNKVQIYMTRYLTTDWLPATLFNNIIS
jgi:hypothetical protein